jgi:hypothetical protein
MHPSIDVYDTEALSQFAVIEPLQDLYWDNKNLPFSIGRMRMSKDGSHLFAVSTWGVAVYDLASDGSRAP